MTSKAALGTKSKLCSFVFRSGRPAPWDHIPRVQNHTPSQTIKYYFFGWTSHVS